MNEDAPTLEIGFAIEATGSFYNLERVQAMMGTTEVKTIKAIGNIERQVNGLNFGGAIAQVSTFGNAASRELQAVARETARAEKSGEAMVRQLQRQSETFGKTASEIRNMRAEARAVAADSAGLTELAGRIRAANTEMNRLEQNALTPIIPTAKLAGHHMQNLAFQFQDLGIQMVAAAQSKRPFSMALTALLQQGAQIQGVMSQAQIGIGGVARAFGAMLLPFAPLSGTVLGDKSAQSESLKRSIEALKEVDTITSVYARQMAASLRSIDNQIGGLATVLVRSGNLSADDQVAQGFKTNAIGSVLSKIPLIGGFLGSLFGTSTKVLASGIYGGATTLDSILAGAGVDARTYSDVEKKKKFFGITTSKKFSTVYGGSVDSSVTDQFGLILRSFNDAIMAAAGPLGTATDVIKSRLSGFVFSLGKIDLTGLSGSEIQEKLAAVFGAAADNMATAAFPGIERFQQVGEGAFETLVRVASTVEAVTDTLSQLGTAVTGLGIDAKVALAGQFDTVSDFSNAAAGYFDAFFTREEQATARAAQMTKVFGSLGIVMPRTLAGFRNLVDAQDLTTDAGRSTYATLLKLAPAFADLMGALGGAKTAADAAEDLREAWTSIGESIADEVRRIRSLNDTVGTTSFATLQGRFNAATLAARGGDQAMARMLPDLSQALLAAAERQATSRQELERIRAVTAASLEATGASILTRTGGLTLDELLDRSAAAQAAATQAAANDVVDATAQQTAALQDELGALRRDLTDGLAAIAGSTGKTASILRNVTDAGGGNSIQMNMAV